MSIVASQACGTASPDRQDLREGPAPRSPSAVPQTADPQTLLAASCVEPLIHVSACSLVCKDSKPKLQNAKQLYVGQSQEIIQRTIKDQNKTSDSAMYDEHQEVPDSIYIAGQLLRQHLHQGSSKLSSQCMLGCVYIAGSRSRCNTAMANMVCTVSTSFPSCI